MPKRDVVYLEGRPAAHIIHRRLAESLDCKIDFIDPFIRWQDLNKGIFFNFLAWVLNAKYLAKKYKDNDIFLVDNLHFTPVIMNWLMRKRKTLVVHLGSHTLYFMVTKKFSPLNRWLHKFILSQYDVLIFEGLMAHEFASSVLKKKLPFHFNTFLGVPSERFLSLKNIKPDLTSTVIIVVANGPAEFRAHYKGLDLMIEAFNIALQKNDQLKLLILGNWSADVVEKLVDTATKEKIHFKGNVSSVEDYLVTASLCLHCSRGDAFPTSTLETMMAGIPTVVSEWTGTKEVVEKIDIRFIVPNDPEVIASRMLWYFGLSIEERLEISAKCRLTASAYTQENAVKHYQDTFEHIYGSFIK